MSNVKGDIAVSVLALLLERTIEYACQDRLGLTYVKSVVIGIATMSVQSKLPEGKIKADDLWLNSFKIREEMEC